MQAQYRALYSFNGVHYWSAMASKAKTASDAQMRGHPLRRNAHPRTPLAITALMGLRAVPIIYLVLELLCSTATCFWSSHQNPSWASGSWGSCSALSDQPAASATRAALKQLLLVLMALKWELLQYQVSWEANLGAYARPASLLDCCCGTVSLVANLPAAKACARNSQILCTDGLSR